MQLYLRYVRIHLKSAMEYKASFVLLTIGQFFMSFTLFLGVYFMYARFGEIGGYTLEQSMLSLSVTLFGYAFASMFFCGFHRFGTMIVKGEYDILMVRPRSTLFQVLAAKIEFADIGRLLQAVVILIMAVVRTQISWTAGKALLLTLMCVSSVFLFAGFHILYASICFFTVEGLEIINILTDGSKEFGQYPAGIYGRRMLAILTVVIPLACIQYYPLLVILDAGYHWSYLIAPIYPVLYFLGCCLLWRFGSRKYRSTGS